MDVLMRITLLALFLLAACEPALTEGDFAAQDLGQSADTRAGDLGEAVVDFEDMNGTWALITDLSACVTITQVEELRSQALELVVIEQEGLRLVETHSVCQIRSTALIGLETVVPEAVFTLPNPFVFESTLFGSYIGADYSTQERAVLWGIEMDNPRRDPLPSDLDATDPRVVDADNDGNPGVTLKVGGGACDLYTVQRDIKSYFGTLQADGSIRGYINSVVEQRALGATNPICAVGFEIRSNRDHSFMQLLRVDERGVNIDADGDGEVTCAELVAAQDNLTQWLAADNERCQ